MSDQTSSYRQIIKTTSLFGGVQVFQILIQIIKSKLLAVLLGTTGMGLASLLTTTTGFISALTCFGLGTSGTKSVAEASGNNDEGRIVYITNVLRKCVWFTGMLGMLLTLILSPWLSQITFGNHDYTVAFIWLSITFILDQLSTGQMVVIRGLRKYRYLANASLVGSLLGLLFSLPLYYFGGIKGVVPAIILSSLLNLILTYHFVKKIDINKGNYKTSDIFEEGIVMLKTGFIINLSGIVGIGASYLIRIFINNIGGIDHVGLYSAGFTLLNSYVGLIFSAMAMDYFPKLSAHASDNYFCRKTINEQAEISFLLLTPFLLIFLLFCPLAIKILFTREFMIIDKMLYWSILGMLFRAASWSISFIFIAKGDARIFFYNEFLASVYTTVFNILGYYFWGLTGIGIAFFLGYFLYLVHMSILSSKLYNIFFQKETFKLFIIQCIFVLSIFITVIFTKGYSKYLLSIPIIILCSLYSYGILDKKVQVTLYLRNSITQIFR